MRILFRCLFLLAALASIPAQAGVVPVQPLTGVAAIASGDDFTCALTTAGGVKCWGFSGQGAVNLTANTTGTPVDVPGLGSGVTAISAGTYHACALTSSNVFCWRGTGQVSGPVAIGGLSGSAVTSIAAGYNRACAVMAAGTVKCWQYSGVPGSPGTFTAASDVNGVANVSRVSVGNMACALTVAGGVKCWDSLAFPTPADVPGLSSGVSAIDVGSVHACAVMATGNVKCWGANWSGQLGGNAGFVDYSNPVDVPGIAGDAQSVSAGGSHSCIVTLAGGAKCWGLGGFGALGDGTVASRLSATPVAALPTVTSISAGGFHTCAVTSTGEARCWGMGPLGNGSYLQKLEPLPLTVGIFTPQAIDFPKPPTTDINAEAFTLQVTASSGLPVSTGTYTPAICTTNGTTVTLLAIGICQVYVNQDGDGRFAKAQLTTSAFLVVGTRGTAKIANLSTRAKVLTGDDVLIGGFVIGGTPCEEGFSIPEYAPPSQNKQVLIRARGPSLGAFGVSAPLANPRIDVHTASGTYGSNNDWNELSYDYPVGTTIQWIGMEPAHARESAMLASLCPGAYTVVVQGVAAGTGVGTVEVFEIDREDHPLVNLSARGRVLTGEDVMIAGLVIQGTGTKRVVINVAGVSLANHGVSGALANPTLTLVRSSDNAVIASNDDWQLQANPADVAAIRATGFQPNHPNEPAIIADLPAGAYTAIVSGANGTTGVALVGVFAAP